MVDEGTLRSQAPEIPWDQPVEIRVIGMSGGRYVCRYCIAMYGIKGSQVASSPFAFDSRLQALDHIEKAHHD